MSVEKKTHLSLNTQETLGNMTALAYPNRLRNLPDPRPVPNISDMVKALSEVRDRAVQKPNTSLWKIYSNIERLMPPQIRGDVHREVAASIHGDCEKRALGLRVAMDLAIPPVLAGIRPYRTGYPEIDDEILQEGLLAVSSMIFRLYPDKYTKYEHSGAAINSRAASKAIGVVASEQHMDAKLVNKGQLMVVRAAVDRLFQEYPYGLQNRDIEAESSQLSAQLDIPSGNLKRYISLRNLHVPILVTDDQEKDLELVREAASPADLSFLKKRYLSDGGKSLSELSEVYGVTDEMIRRREAQVIERIRHAIATLDKPSDTDARPFSSDSTADLTVGQFLTRLRTENNISLPLLARVLGCKIKYLSDIESGAIEISRTQLKRIGLPLGITVLSDKEARMNKVKSPKQRAKKKLI